MYIIILKADFTNTNMKKNNLKMQIEKLQNSLLTLQLIY